MRALAASPAPAPAMPRAALLVRRVRLEARLRDERTRTRWVLGPALVSEAVGLAVLGAVGLYAAGATSVALSGASASHLGGLIGLLGALALVLWVLGDEPVGLR